jgi:hypothetical protein
MPELTNTPDPPMAPDQVPSRILDRLEAEAGSLKLHEVVALAREHASVYADSGGRAAFNELFSVGQGAAACALLQREFVARNEAIEVAVKAMWGSPTDPRAPLTEDDIEKVAAEHNIDVTTSAGLNEAATIAGLDRQIAKVREDLAPQASEHPWLDTRPLAASEIGPPWSTDALERDRLRWEAADLEDTFGPFDGDTWRAYVEQARDLVGEQVQARLDREVHELESWRLRQLGMADAEAARRESLEAAGRAGRDLLGSMVA